MIKKINKILDWILVIMMLGLVAQMIFILKTFDLGTVIITCITLSLAIKNYGQK